MTWEVGVSRFRTYKESLAGLGHLEEDQTQGTKVLDPMSLRKSWDRGPYELGELET